MFKRIFNNKIVRNSLVLINGTIISQVINIILSPIMSRLYLPSDFGRYSLINAIVVLLAVIANGKYDLAIMNSEDEISKSKSTYFGGMILTVFNCIIFLIIGSILVIFTPLLSTLTTIDLCIIVIFTFFSSNNSILNVWLNKNGHYKVIAKNRILYALVHAIGIIAFGFLNMSYMGIIIAVLCAYSCQFIYVYLFLYRRTDFGQYKFKYEETLLQLKTYSAFPKFQMPSLLLNNASTQLPVILFTNLFSDTVSGWYSMTVKIINLPMQIVGSALGEVYFKEASEIKKHNDDKRLSDFTYKTFKSLLYLGILPMGVLFAYGDVLFKFVLGSEWEMAGLYARYLSPWYFIVFITSPFTHLFTVLSKQKKNFILNILMLLSRVIAIASGYFIFNGDSNLTIICFAVTGFIIWVATNGYLFKFLNISYKKTIIQPILLFALVCFLLFQTRIIFFSFIRW